MKVVTLILIFLFIVTGVFYFQLTGRATFQSESVFVERSIDGDTIETEVGKIRLLGVNTPEKNMPGYQLAKDFLKSFENKTVEIEISGTDKYGRILAHVFNDGVHLNEQILKKGYGSLYYYEHDSYYERLKRSEDFARLNKLGIWEESPDKECFILLELKYDEGSKRCVTKEVLKIENVCDKDIALIIKDDATHIYREQIKAKSIFIRNFSCIWNDEGDSLYAWDDRGMVLFYRY